MNREKIEEIVHNFFTEELEVDEERLRPESRLKEDIGVDSLDIVDVIAMVNEMFGFKLRPEDIRNVSTLNQFISFIESRVG